MTIKVFAKLCDCNPQTLRYYDSVGLLKQLRSTPGQATGTTTRSRQ